mmetsp:Transcript_106891/g.312504  ORF Transcript_106891/g.312504 Transcript_106891/m.312504 type:complete len:563 (-) Transcript_106891:57-1745(-)
MVWAGRPRGRPAWRLLALGLAWRGLAIDGQSYKASDEETERVWNDPNCERTRGSEHGVDWDEVREHLLSVPFPQSLPTIGAVVKRLQRIPELDREAALCPFGLIAVLFFWIKYLIEGEVPQLAAALAYSSLLDTFASGMHPKLLDRSDWLVKDHRIVALRRALLGRRRAALGTPARFPRVFVYDKETPELRMLTQGASFCGKGQWGMEVHIHEWLLSSGHLTKDPAEADFFFVPAYSICMFEGGFFPFPEINELYTKLVKGLPHFQSSRGRDHIFTFGSGMSANVFRSWRTEIPESIFLTPETWLFNDFPDIVEPCFDTWKDIAIPGYLHRHEVLSLTSQARPLAQREHLAVFLGRADPSRGAHPGTGGADVRGAIRQLHLEGKIFVGQNLSIPDMHGVMGNARFCFVPKGKSAWSLRFYEALFANCVPVVLSDFWELPFQDFLDLPSFVIKWPMESVGDELLDYLNKLPDSVLEAYMESSRRLRCWYVFPPILHEVDVDPEHDQLYKVCPDLADENAFEGIMHQLERKRRASTTMGRFFGPLQGSLPAELFEPIGDESKDG